jgi:hypothetical protein
VTALAVALETNVNRLLLGPDADDQPIGLTPELAPQQRAAWAWTCGDYVAGAPWPWATFAPHGGRPAELRRFQEETRPHDPPLYLTPEDAERLWPWRDQLNRVYRSMIEEGLTAADFRAVLRMMLGREVTFTGEADD